MVSYADGGDGTQVSGEWIQEGGKWWFSHGDGSRTVNDWEFINGRWYLFDAAGYMRDEKLVTRDGQTYLFDEDGALITDTIYDYNGNTYVIDSDGHAYISYNVLGMGGNAYLSYMGSDGQWHQYVADAHDSPAAEQENDDSQDEPAAEPEAPPKSEDELAAEALAASLISEITNEGMTKPEKADAIYNWLRANITYTTTGPKSDEAYSALYGFRHRSGCCYEYYSMAHYLLEAAGMPNIPVVRASDGDHYWNLTNVDGTWYHFDATPRRTGGRWCLVTTSYLKANSWSSHNYDVSAYPATP